MSAPDRFLCVEKIHPLAGWAIHIEKSDLKLVSVFRTAQGLRLGKEWTVVWEKREVAKRSGLENTYHHHQSEAIEAARAGAKKLGAIINDPDEKKRPDVDENAIKAIEQVFNRGGILTIEDARQIEKCHPQFMQWLMTSSGEQWPVVYERMKTPGKRGSAAKNHRMLAELIHYLMKLAKV